MDYSHLEDLDVVKVGPYFFQNLKNYKVALVIWE